ncbi:hypothetical protein FRC07_012597, partial [Ceratobasidium sp. 392]
PDITPSVMEAQEYNNKANPFPVDFDKEWTSNHYDTGISIRGRNSCLDEDRTYTDEDPLYEDGMDLPDEENRDDGWEDEEGFEYREGREPGEEWECVEEQGEDIDGLLKENNKRTAGVSHKAKGPQNLANQCGPWRPYPSKAIFLTDLLFNSPRMHFSCSQKSGILRYAKALGAKGVPSLDAVEKWQCRLRATVGTPPKRSVSTEGNIFYVNEIGPGLAKHMSNPLSREGMCFYPHYNPGEMSQTWHGSKMIKDVPDHLLSPTMRFDGHIYYVDELVQRRNGDYFIPKRWILHGQDEKWCIGLVVKVVLGKFIVEEDTRVMVSLSTFCRSYEEIIKECPLEAFAEGSRKHATHMPHPLRRTAQGRPVYSIPVIVFMDDVSGAVTTQWNKHMCTYMSNGAIPREKQQSEFNIRFVTTSTHATPSELMQGIRKSFEDAFKSPIEAYDVELKEK